MDSAVFGLCDCTCITYPWGFLTSDSLKTQRTAGLSGEWSDKALHTGPDIPKAFNISSLFSVLAQWCLWSLWDVLE